MGRRVGTVGVTLLMGLAGLAAPARAMDAGDGTSEPPGLQGRATHLTLLTTEESGCVEIAMSRAVTAAGARALVPERYVPTRLESASPASSFRMWDYVCDHVRVDRQTYAPRTQVSITAVAIASRDGAPVSAYYLTSIRTDNAVLAARYRQVGLPAAFDRAISSTVSSRDESPFGAAFDVPGDDRHSITAVAAAAPVEQQASGGPTLFHEGTAGEVVLRYENTAIGAVPAQISADYRQHQTLAPIVALARLLQVNGSTFPNGLTTGTWGASLSRVD